jgi:hypothetical protein
MQETEKIWMNGERVPWADAKVHVLSHAMHYAPASSRAFAPTPRIAALPCSG